MDGSCTDESTSDSISPAAMVSVKKSKSPESFRRVGSGTSVVLDSAESGVEAESKKLPSSQYKGVVPQPNGRWGAQIYEKHQRVWLGTFNEEEEAAKVYDIAAQKFRGRDAISNFKPLPDTTDEDDIESVFLNSHSKTEIVDMLRKHTYNEELEQSKSKYGCHGNGKRTSGASSGSDRVVKARHHLFEKAVTPSDVGKLNRLVIPKQQAEKHFPLEIGSISKGVLLNFEDNGGKVWRFRYSYWSSSQSYVLTKGWSRFVKEKNMKAGDIVSFQISAGQDKQLYIDWKSRTGACITVLPNPVNPVQVVRLFGVNIFKIPVSSVVDNSNWNGKRMGEMGSLALDCCKKQRVVGAL